MNPKRQPHNPSSDVDERWMRSALSEAERCARAGEVPVGAVLVADNSLIATGGNSPISTCDPSAHAEIITLRAGGIALGNYRLLGTTLYVTLEPCIMCMGAIILARIDRLVFGAKDPKSGAVVSTYSIGQDNRLNHSMTVRGGVLQDECSHILRSFFKAKRG